MSQAKRYTHLAALTGRENHLDSAYHAAFYLLSYDPDVYEVACRFVTYDGIDFSGMKRSTRGFDERTRFVVDIAHNLFSYNSTCKATPFEYRQLRHNYDAKTELSEGFDFADKTLNEIADRVFKIKVALPKGRISYQLLPPTVKEQVDSLVDFILKQTPALQKQKDDYVQSKMQMVLLYGGGEKYLNTQRERFGAEADKIIANRILGMVKALNRLDSEYCSADYHQSRKAYYSEQILLDALSMLSVLTDTANGEYDEAKRHGELSKAARKELYLKNQDKGYEH